MPSYLLLKLRSIMADIFACMHACMHVRTGMLFIRLLHDIEKLCIESQNVPSCFHTITYFNSCSPSADMIFDGALTGL